MWTPHLTWWAGVMPLPCHRAQCLMVIRTSSMLTIQCLNLPFIWMQTHYQEVVAFRKVVIELWWTRFQFNNSWINNIAKMFHCKNVYELLVLVLANSNYQNLGFANALVTHTKNISPLPLLVAFVSSSKKVNIPWWVVQIPGAIRFLCVDQLESLQLVFGHHVGKPNNVTSKNPLSSLMLTILSYLIRSQAYIILPASFFKWKHWRVCRNLVK